MPGRAEAPTLAEALRLTPAQLGRISARRRVALEADLAEHLARDQREHQLAYYEPLHADARRLHLSEAREVGAAGGNRAGKSDILLVEAAIRMTGEVPLSLQRDYPAARRPPPCRVRLVVRSLVTAWDLNLKPKLQWWQWNGKLDARGKPGDPALGHWGWIPRTALKDGDWDHSWSERHRTLTLENGSTLSVMSHEQDLQDFAQGAFHVVLEDELPPEAIHRENRMRVLDYGGQVYTAGTGRDEREAAVDAAWFYDTIYLPGLSGTDPAATFAVTLWTEQNRTLALADLAWAQDGLTPEQQLVRLRGGFLHLAGLIFPTWTAQPKQWCPACREGTFAAASACRRCGGAALVPYCHVWDDEDLAWPGPAAWPTLFYMDPHQSRATACAWFKVDPQDGWWQIAEMEIPGGAGDVRAACEAYERAHGLTPLWRVGDPKITGQANQFARDFEGRPFTIREAFEEAGFDFRDANTNFTVGRERVLAALEPNPWTRVPRLRVHRDCRRTIYQMEHFVWDERGRSPVRKDQPSRSHSDFPALMRYLAMDDPGWRDLERWRRPHTPSPPAGARNRWTGY